MLLLIRFYLGIVFTEDNKGSKGCNRIFGHPFVVFGQTAYAFLSRVVRHRHIMDVFIRLHREQTVNCRGADFNRDGRSDYLLFNPSTRQSAIRYLSGVKWVGSAYGPTIASGYQLTGTADFNGDGSPDYVFYASTRQTAIWYLSGVTRVGGAYGPTLTADWNLVAP